MLTWDLQQIFLRPTISRRRCPSRRSKPNVLHAMEAAYLLNTLLNNLETEFASAFSEAYNQNKKKKNAPRKITRRNWTQIIYHLALENFFELIYFSKGKTKPSQLKKQSLFILELKSGLIFRQLIKVDRISESFKEEQFIVSSRKKQIWQK